MPTDITNKQVSVVSTLEHSRRTCLPITTGMQPATVTTICRSPQAPPSGERLQTKVVLMRPILKHVRHLQAHAPVSCCSARQRSGTSPGNVCA
eukprot:1140066-Pelagomonas_calceolata.AAC.6